MPVIIDRGGPADPAALKLATRKNNWIHNEPAIERSPIEMRAAVNYATSGRPNVLLRSAASHYNCMGLVFAARRTTIDIDRWTLIRGDDEYRRLANGEALTLGDVVVYKRAGVVTHIGLIGEVRPGESGPIVMVLSQWGFDGEYRHPLSEVPPLYGSAVEFWTDRRPAR